MSTREWAGRWLLTVAILATPGFQVTADWMSDHITNPEWPPHAKYHLIVYHLTLILFSVAAVAGCWKWRSSEFAAGLAAAAVFAFWVPYYLAAAFPQASPYATEELAARGVPVQFFVGGVLMAGAAVGLALVRSSHRK
jgi:hypothetical protein